MTLTAANPGGWSLNEVLTSLQMTHLQNELLKAIDGVNGGSYTLAAPLTIGGADVTFASDVFLTGATSFGSITIPSGETLTVSAGATASFLGNAAFTGGADLDLASGSEIDMASGSALLLGGSMNVEAGAQLVLLTGSDMFVEGQAQLHVQASGLGGLFIDNGGELQVNSGGEVIVEGGGVVTFQTGAGGGQAVWQSGAFATFQAGSGIFIEDAGDIGINDSNETFRTTLIPVVAVDWAPVWSTEFVYEQTNIGAGRFIVFPLAVPPGDTLENVFVRLNGAPGHGGVLPTTMPVVSIVRSAIDGTLTTLASTTDSSGSAAAYETSHNVLLDSGTVTFGAMPILATVNPLYCVVIGESGGSAVVGLELSSLTGNITARSYRGAEAVFS